MIVGINLKHRIVALEDGGILPITQLWNGDGEQTDDPDDALAFTCGTDQFGYVAAAVDLFPLLTVH